MARSQESKISQKEIVNKYFKDRLVKDLFIFSGSGNNIRIECTNLANEMFKELKQKCGVTEDDIDAYLKRVTAKLMLSSLEKEDEF